MGTRLLYSLIALGILFLELSGILLSRSQSDFHPPPASSLSFTSTKQHKDFVLVTDHRSGCRLYRRNGKLLYQFQGFFCLFTKNGQVAMAVKDRLMMFDSDMDLLWSRKLSVHHELTETAKGELLLLSNEKRTFLEVPVSFDVILKLDVKSGKTLFRWSAADHVEELLATMKLRLSGDKEEDFALLEQQNILVPIQGQLQANDGAKGATFVFLHINSLQEIPRTPLAAHKGFRPGHILTDLCPKKILLTLHPTSGKVAWSFRRHRATSNRCQHTPRLLPNGRMLVFLGDNRVEKSDGTVLSYSSVWEFDPLTGKTVWEYTSPDKGWFYSPWLSGAQRLKNGNTLITYGMGKHGGQAFEVTRNKRVVWRWKNPLLYKDSGKRKAMYRVETVPADRVRRILQNLGVLEKPHSQTITTAM